MIGTKALRYGKNLFHLKNSVAGGNPKQEQSKHNFNKNKILVDFKYLNILHGHNIVLAHAARRLHLCHIAFFFSD